MDGDRASKNCVISQIILLHKQDIGYNEIAQSVGVSRRTVQRWVTRFKKEGEAAIPTRGAPPGGIRKLTPADERHLRILIERNPRASAKQLKEENPGLLSSVSVRTIRRTLHDRMRYKSFSPKQKPLLTKRHKRNRLAYAKRVLAEFPSEKFKEVLYSDEATFSISCNKTGRVYRRPGSDPLDPKYIDSTVKHPPTLMVWGCFSFYGVGPLVFLPKNQYMNAPRYFELLLDYLPDALETCKASVYQQDGAPCHTAQLVKDWFQFCGVELITDWPGNSPDLNPIENLWSIVKGRLQDRDTSTLEKLQKEIQDVWDNFPPEQLQNLALSVPGRLKTVVKKRGAIRSIRTTTSDGGRW